MANEQEQRAALQAWVEAKRNYLAADEEHDKALEALTAAEERLYAACGGQPAETTDGGPVQVS